MLQSLLKISEKFINLSGVFNDNVTSTSYMKLICKYCLPGEFGKIGHRHVQINKMILNMANCLGSNFILKSRFIQYRMLGNSMESFIKLFNLLQQIFIGQVVTSSIEKIRCIDIV